MAIPQQDIALEALTENSVSALGGEDHFPQGSNPSSDNAESASELDKLIDGAEKKKADVEPSAEDLKPISEDKPKAEEPKVEEKPKPTTEEKPKVDEAAKPEEKPKPDFRQVELPPYAAESTKAAFTLVKEGARKELDSVTTKLTETTKQLEELRKVASSVPPDVQQKLAELEELRKERKLANIESDEEFKAKFVKPIVDNEALIYAKIAELKGGPEAVAKIKEMGGLDRVDLDPILNRLQPSLRRFIEAKLVENVGLTEQRKNELARVKAEADTYFKTRDEKTAKQREEEDTKAIAEVNKTLGTQPWMQKREVPTDATPEVRAQIEGDNAFAEKARTLVADVLAGENTPAARAQLAIAVVAAHRFKLENAALLAQVEQLKKQSDELERVKRASAPSAARKSATPTPPNKPKQNQNIFGGPATTESELDRLIDEAQAAADRS